MTYRFAIALAGTLVLCAGNHARAAYMYDWSTISGNTVTLNSDHGDYQMKITNEPNRGPLSDSTDTTASQLTIVHVNGKPWTMDTFHGAFDLKLVVQDQANSMTNDGLMGHANPLIYHISFTTTVFSDGGTMTSALSLAPTTSTVNLGGDLFSAHLPSTGQWFVAPPTVGSVNTGSVGLSIDFTPKGPPTNPTPEPTSLVLAGLGVGFAGFSAWRKRRRLSITLA
jgi:hypothetical protein